MNMKLKKSTKTMGLFLKVTIFVIKRQDLLYP